MVDYHSLIDKYYAGQDQLRALLYLHSRQVADLSLSVCARHPEWQVDTQFIKEAAMLHDIGIYLCNAPAIHCNGSEPYIRHGYLGAELLRQEGLPMHARVAERHTGSGLTREQIIAEHLPLPEQDYLPETLEEKIICYADKFFSKSHPLRQENMSNIRRKMSLFGYGSLERWLHLEYEMISKDTPIANIASAMHG